MKVLNIVASLITSALVSNSFIAPAQAATWDYEPSVASFTYDRYVGKVYVGKVEVSTGELTDNYAYTQTVVNYFGPSCNSDSNLVLNVTSKVSNSEDGSWSIAYSGDVYASENSWGQIVLANDEYKTYPTDIELTIKAHCESSNSYSYDYEYYEQEITDTANHAAESTVNAVEKIGDDIADVFGW